MACAQTPEKRYLNSPWVCVFDYRIVIVFGTCACHTNCAVMQAGAHSIARMDCKGDQAVSCQFGGSDGN